MKKIISLVIALIILLALILLISPLWACDVPTIEKNAAADTSMFVVVEETSQWTVVYHRSTKVMYVFTERYNSEASTRSSFTVLIDADGKPLLWRGE